VRALDVVVEAVADHQRFLWADALRFQPCGQDAEHVRVRFAEAVLEGKEAEVGCKHGPAQTGGGERRIQFPQSVRLGV
jgi:hypothetical protein